MFAIGALMAFQSANNMANELLRLALAQAVDAARLALFLDDPAAANGYPFVVAGRGGAGLAAAMDRLATTDPDSNPLLPRLGFGSNGWVVAPEKSASGVALYAFDSHDELGLPNLFYELHLFFADGRQLRGWSVAGLPGVINGFNESIAWGFTNSGDSQDLFVETRSADDPLLFRDGAQWYRAEVENVSIPVRGAAPATAGDRPHPQRPADQRRARHQPGLDRKPDRGAEPGQPAGAQPGARLAGVYRCPGPLPRPHPERHLRRRARQHRFSHRGGDSPTRQGRWPAATGRQRPG